MDSTQRLCRTSFTLAALSVLLLVFVGIEHELLGNTINTISFNLFALTIQSVLAIGALVSGVVALRKLSRHQAVPEKFTAAAWVGTIVGGFLSVPAIGMALVFIKEMT